MNKEAFIQLLCDVGGCVISDAEDVADAILEKCVIVERGSGRHKDADVLHKAVEGAEFEMTTDPDGKEAWEDGRAFKWTDRYRIKGPQKIYEWIWEFEENGVPCRTIHLTEDEVFSKFGNKRMHKVPETKQERTAV